MDPTLMTAKHAAGIGRHATNDNPNCPDCRDGWLAQLRQERHLKHLAQYSGHEDYLDSL